MSATRHQPWLRRLRHKHRSALRSAWQRLRERPLAHAFALTLLGLALFALLLLRLGLDQFQSLSSPLDHARGLSLFLTPDTDPQHVETLATELEADPRVARVQRISPSQGLEELIALGDRHSALAALPDNPLPWVLAVEAVDRHAGTQLAEHWRQRPEVDHLADDHHWQTRADTVLRSARALGWMLIVLVAAASVLLTANAVRTIRVEGAAERALQRVFGASEADLRRPYVYLGLLYGLCSGLLAIVLVLLVSILLSPILAELTDTFALPPVPASRTGFWLASCLPVAAVLGAVGAWLGCRFERDLEFTE